MTLAFNKRGQIGDQALLFVFVMVMIFIAGGLFVGTLVFYGDGADVRRADASILSGNVAFCLNEFGGEVLKDQKSFFEKCGLNEGVFGDNKFGVKVCNGGEKECQSSSANVLIQVGSNFEACLLTSYNTAYPLCSFGNAEFNGEKYIIISSSNQRTQVERTA